MVPSFRLRVFPNFFPTWKLGIPTASPPQLTIALYAEISASCGRAKLGNSQLSQLPSQLDFSKEFQCVVQVGKLGNELPPYGGCACASERRAHTRPWGRVRTTGPPS